MKAFAVADNDTNVSTQSISGSALDEGVDVLVVRGARRVSIIAELSVRPRGWWHSAQMFRQPVTPDWFNATSRDELLNSQAHYPFRVLLEFRDQSDVNPSEVISFGTYEWVLKDLAVDKSACWWSEIYLYVSRCLILWSRFLRYVQYVKRYVLIRLK